MPGRGRPVARQASRCRPAPRAERRGGADRWPGWLGRAGDRRRRPDHLSPDHMVTIGTGRGDPRAWVQAAYLLLGAMQDGQTGPRGKLPAGSQIAAQLGVHPITVARAHRELTDSLDRTRPSPGSAPVGFGGGVWAGPGA